MNGKTTSLIKNFSYSLTANLIALISSVLVILIVPKLIGIQDYGYWQLYLFYTSYVGFMQFGWTDGIYLRYGGKEYKSLNKNLFFSQFYMLVIFQLLIALTISILCFFIVKDSDRAFIIIATAVCLLFMNIRHMPLFIFQSTNLIKEYAMITVVEKIVYLSLLIVILMLGFREFKLLIILDLVGKFISMIVALYFSKEIVFRKFTTFYFSFNETIKNINVGIKLMFANIASMLIIGIVRFGIERSWDVKTFGEISLVLSISNFMMLFINAFSIIFFPVIKRMNQDKIKDVYISMKDSLMIIMLGLLILYFPLKLMLLSWLPAYTNSLFYLAVLFPLCIYEGKMALLINTYLKSLRKEKAIMRINIWVMWISIVCTIITTIVLKNLSLAVFSILLLVALKSIIAEIYLSRVLNISIFKDLFKETLLILIFITVNLYTDNYYAFLIYLLAYSIFLIIIREKIKYGLQNIKIIISKRNSIV